jgi:hypothetical protein
LSANHKQWKLHLLVLPVVRPIESLALLRNIDPERTLIANGARPENGKPN